MELLNSEICLESGVLTPADLNVLAYVIFNAPHLVKNCALRHAYCMKDKWKNKEIDYADVLSSSIQSSIIV